MRQHRCAVCRVIVLLNNCGFSVSEGGVREKHSADALAFMITHDDMPLRTPEKEGFRTFCKAIQPHYKPPAESTSTKRIVQKYEKLKEDFGRRIAAADHLSLTCDIWTHKETMRSYLGLTVHFREGKITVKII